MGEGVGEGEEKARNGTGERAHEEKGPGEGEEKGPGEGEENGRARRKGGRTARLRKFPARSTASALFSFSPFASSLPLSLSRFSRSLLLLSLVVVDPNVIPCSAPFSRCTSALSFAAARARARTHRNADVGREVHSDSGAAADGARGRAAVVLIGRPVRPEDVHGLVALLKWSGQCGPTEALDLGPTGLGLRGREAEGEYGRMGHDSCTRPYLRLVLARGLDPKTHPHPNHASTT